MIKLKNNQMMNKMKKQMKKKKEWWWTKSTKPFSGISGSFCASYSPYSTTPYLVLCRWRIWLRNLDRKWEYRTKTLYCFSRLFCWNRKIQKWSCIKICLTTRIIVKWDLSSSKTAFFSNSGVCFTIADFCNSQSAKSYKNIK